MGRDRERFHEVYADATLHRRGEKPREEVIQERRGTKANLRLSESGKASSAKWKKQEVTRAAAQEGEWDFLFPSCIKSESRGGKPR